MATICRGSDSKRKEEKGGKRERERETNGLLPKKGRNWIEPEALAAAAEIPTQGVFPDFDLTLYFFPE